MLKKIVVVVGLVGASIGGATAVSAVPPAPGSGCGAGHDLVTAEQAVNLLDVRRYTAEQIAQLPANIAALDDNGDGLVCLKQFTPNQGQDMKTGFDDFVHSAINDNVAGPKK